MKNSSLKILALGGVAGPILFTIVIFICSSLRIDYNHISQFISELGATNSPNATLMNFAGFIPSGLMIAAFGISLTLLTPKHLLSRIGSFLIIIFGLGMSFVGNFSCDIGCPPVGSLENNIHDQVSGPIFLLGIVGIFLLGIAFRKLKFLHGLWKYSVLSALISFGFMVALIISIDSRVTTGLWQRLLLLTIFLWFAIVGIRLFNITKNRVAYN